MKKQVSSNHPSQSKLTHFFVKKTTAIPENHRKSENNLNGSNQNNGNISSAAAVVENRGLDGSRLQKNSSPSKLPTTRRSPRKPPLKTFLLYSPSPQEPSCKKNDLKVPRDKKLSPTKSPTKKCQKTPEKKVHTTILQFTPPKKSRVTDDSDTPNSIGEVGKQKELESSSDSDLCVLPRKRKFMGSPLKEKKEENELSACHAKLSTPEKENGGPIVLNDSAWGDETDFINIGEDSIIISPKKIHVKRPKYSGEELLSVRKSLSNTEESTSSDKTKKCLDHNLSSYFMNDFILDDKWNLKFDKLQRYKVVEIDRSNKGLRLTLKSLSENLTGVCIVRSPWDECSISLKDIISVRGTKRDEGWVVDWNGLLVINPDRLISGTTIIGSVYCMRKSILSHIFKEPGGTKDCMVIGSVVHGVFQEVLKNRLGFRDQIEEVCKKTIMSREFLLQLFLSNMNFEETSSQIQSFVPHIHAFMKKYVFGEANQTNNQNWSGEIIETEDIEENIWSPVLGIKGKVDATVQVKLNKKNIVKVMPLELKTGKVSFSIEHRGQVILYCMLLQQLGRNVDSGLLLYLNSGVDMKEIKCEERETRDLTLLRNGLCHWLNKMSLVEASDSIKPPTLPPPIDRRTCSTCPYLIPCSVALRSENNFQQLPEDHRLKEFGPEATSHLSDDHINFVFHWLGLLLLEKNSCTSSISDIWSIDPDLREKSGKCLAQMKMDDCIKEMDGGFKSSFSKIDESLLETEFTVGQLIIVSTEGHFAHALGVVQSLSPISVTLLLDKFFKTNKPLFLDAYESDGTFTILANSLSCLLENSARAALLRELIIDLKIPTFSSKLSVKIKKIGSDIFDRLNREQVRAVLQAISSENYILIKGMPGTGKTTTMAALIELLTRLKKRVLVTSFTHSAIDNILLNLVGKVKMLRLGPDHRVHEKLKNVTENYFVKNLKEVTPARIEEIFSSKEVIGVTCFGSKHPWVERQTFDVCLIDEATQVPLPGILKPISVSTKFILVGDPKQLPPLVLSKQARELGLGKSLFERLERPAVTSPLTLQYRMNKTITSLANDFTYGGLLQCANEAVQTATISIPKGLDEALPQWLKDTLSCDLQKSVMVLDTGKCEVSSDAGENKTEATLVVKIVQALLQGGLPGESIGIIATYNRQVSLLKSEVSQSIEVNTVDQYQGRDKEIIIYSTTRTFASAEKKDILSDWNRLTVGITRAKKKLIILGNVNVLRTYENFAKLLSSVPADNFIKVQLDQT